MKDGCLNLTRAYRFYNKKTDYEKEFRVSLQEYRDICKEFNQMVVEDVLAGKPFKIPFQLGVIWIKKFKMNWDNPPIDWNETNATGVKSYHLNRHSDEYCAGFRWAKKIKNTTNAIYYSFKPTWHNMRKVSAIMNEPNGHKRYFTEQKF